MSFTSHEQARTYIELEMEMAQRTLYRPDWENVLQAAEWLDHSEDSELLALTVVAAGLLYLRVV